MLALLVLFSSSNPRICICHSFCDLCGGDELQVDIVSDYKSDRVVREQIRANADIYFTIQNEFDTKDFKPVINLGSLMNRNIEIKMGETNKETSSAVTIMFSSDENYEQTSMKITGLNIKMVDLAKSENKNVDLVFNEFSFKSGKWKNILSFESTKNSEYSMKTTKFQGDIAFARVFTSFKITGAQTPIELYTGTDDYDIIFDSDRLNWADAIRIAFTGEILFNEKSTIRIIGNKANISVKLKNSLSRSQIPTFELSNLQNILILGEWPRATESECFIIKAPGIYLNLEVESSLFPFGIKDCAECHLKLYKDIGILGQIETQGKLYIYNYYLSQGKNLNVHINNYRGPFVGATDATIQVSINSFVYNQNSTLNQIFPLGIAISNSISSFTSVESFSIGTVNNLFEKIIIYSTVDQNRTDDQMSYILTNSLLAATFPKVDVLGTLLSVEFESIHGLPYVHGFSNAANCLYVAQDSLNSKTNLRIKGSSPSQLPVKYCYGTNCLPVDGMVLKDNEITDLVTIGKFSSNYQKYEFIISKALTDSIDLSTVSIRNLVLGFIGKTSVNFKVILPNMKISSLTIKNLRVASDISINTNSLVLEKTQSNTGTVSIICDTIDTDANSFNFISKNTQDLKIAIRAKISATVVNINNNGIFCMSNTLKWANIYDLTIEGTRITLNAATSTVKVKGFNITLIEDSPMAVTFQGNWDKMNFFDDNYIRVYTQGFDVTAVFKQSYLHPNIKFEGAIKFTLNYGGDEFIYCVWPDDQKEDICYSVDSYLTLSESQLSNFDLGTTDFTKYVFNLVGFTEENPLRIDLDIFDKYEFAFSGTATNRANVILAPSSSAKSIGRLTSISFQYVDIFLESDTLQLGILDTLYAKMINKNITIDANTLKCDWEFIHEIDNIIIHDTLTIVPGKGIPENFICNLTVEGTFTASLDPHPLNIDLGDQILRINDTAIFHVSNKENTIKTNKRFIPIVFTNNDRVTKGIPVLNIEAINGGDLVFKGIFPIDSKIKINKPGGNLYINNIGTPIEIFQPANNYNIILNSSSGSIRGPITLLHDRILCFDKTNEVSGSLTIGTINCEFTKDGSTNLQIISPYLNMIVNNIINNKVFSTKVMLEFPFNSFNMATMRINKMENCAVHQDINIKALVYTDSPRPAILDRDIIFLSVPTAIKPVLKLVWFDKSNFNINPMHGFAYHNVLGFKTSTIEVTSVSLTAVRKPESIPFYIECSNAIYEDESEFRIVSTRQEGLQEIPSKIPPGVTVVILKLRVSLYNNIIINISGIDDPTRHIDFSIIGIGDTDKNIYMNEPGAGISKLSLINLRITQEMDFTYPPDLYFEKLTFENYTSLGNSVEILDTDINSFNTFSKNSRYLTEIKVRDANLIKFSDDGWEVSRYRFSKPVFFKRDFFPGISFQSAITTELSLMDPYHQKTVAPVTIYGTNHVIFEEGWENIVNYEGLRYINDSEEIIVSTVCYPMPNIFPHNSKVTRYFENVNSTKLFTFPEIYVFDGNQTLDLSRGSQNIMYGKNFTAKGNSMLEFSNGELQVETLKFLNDSVVSLPSLNAKELIEFEPESKATFGLRQATSNLVFKFHWKFNKFPTLKLASSTGTPGKIEILLDDPNPDLNDYHFAIYRATFSIITGSFPCDVWAQKISFISNISYFNQTNDLIFDVKCDSIALLGSVMNIIAAHELPHHEDKAESKKIDLRIIIGISIGSFILFAIIACVGVVCYSKKKYEKLINSKPIKVRRMTTWKETNEKEQYTT